MSLALLPYIIIREEPYEILIEVHNSIDLNKLEFSFNTDKFLYFYNEGYPVGGINLSKLKLSPQRLSLITILFSKDINAENVDVFYAATIQLS